MKKTITTILITLVVLIAGFFVYIASGAYDVSQLSPHNALTKAVINMTKHSSIDKRMKENGQQSSACAQNKRGFIALFRGKIVWRTLDKFPGPENARSQ